METITSRKLWGRSLTVASLRRWVIYQPLAILMAILMLPTLSWMESGGTAPRPFQASAQNNTINDTTPPTAPSSLTANLNPFVQPSGALDLNWTASTDPESPNLTYHVESSLVSTTICGASGCTSSPGFSQIGTTTTTQFQDTAFNLSALNSAAQTMLYRVRASDPSGHYSAYSDVVQFPRKIAASGNSIIQTYYPCVGSTCYFGYVQDLKQLESDAVNAYLAAHNLPETDAHIIYDDGRADLRNAIRGYMLAILMGIISKPATPCPNETPSSSCRTAHERSLYSWLQTLVQANEIALYSAAISQYHAWYVDPCHFTLDSQTAQAVSVSYTGTPWCEVGYTLIPTQPSVPAFKYFMSYGMEQSYGKSAQTYSNFASLVSGTSVNVTAVAGIFAAASVEIAAVVTILLASSFAAAASAFAAAGGTITALTAGSAVLSAAYTISGSTVAALGGVAAAAAGVAIFILIGVAIGVAALIELLNYDNTISQLNGLINSYNQVATTPPDLTTFLDATGQFKLNQTLVSQTVPDNPSTATLPAHQPTDRLFGITPQNSTETIGSSLSYADWNGVKWSAQTWGGWFVQSCISTQGCPQADSIAADIEYIDWSGAKRMASRIGDKLVVIKQNPDSTDKPCPADQTAGITLLPGSDCWSYIDTKIQLKAADGTLETVRLVPQAPTTTTITANPITYNANGSVTVAVSSAAGTPAGSVSLSVDGGSAASQALNGSGQATFTVTTPTAGDHTLSASYAQQGNFAASSAPGTLHVNKSPTATTIASGLSTATVAGQGYSVGVNVASGAPGAGTPTGTVTVSDGSASCNATLSGGSGSCTLTSTTTGTKSINATYNSDGNYLTSSTSGSHTVNKADTAITVTSSKNPSTFGDSVTFTASLSVKTPGSGTPTGISWTIDEQSAGTGSTLSIASLTAGTHKVSASYAGDSNFNGSSGNLVNGQVVNGYPVAATLSLSAPSPNYSDQETFTISVPNATVNGLTATNAGTVVGLSIGTQKLGTCTLAASGSANTCSLTAALIEPSATAAGAPTGTPPNGQMAPGSHTVSADFNVNSNFSVTGNSTTVPIAQQKATAVYTGNLFYGVGTATSGTIVLSATIRDPQTTTSNPAYGDIRNARVTFIDRLTGNVFSGCANLPVGLVNTSDSTFGSVSCTSTVALGTYQVATLVGYSNATTVNKASYYADNNSSEDTNVTVAPTGPGQISGGGHLKLTNASGKLTPTNSGAGAQSNQNFGFNVATNKSGTNLQGHLNAIIRSQVDTSGNACSVSHPGYTTCVYQVKSTAISSLTVVKAPNALCPANTPTGSECASFISNGVINDVTIPNVSTGIDGSVTMLVNMVDNGNSGSDLISFQVNAASNKGGGLWYSSNWTGTQTAEQGLAAGGLSAQ